MNKLDAAGCLVQWFIELSQFNFKYRPQSTIKVHVLIDFITEFTFSSDDQTQFWTIHADGSFIKELGGVGVIMISPNKDILKYGVQLQFPTVDTVFCPPSIYVPNPENFKNIIFSPWGHKNIKIDMAQPVLALEYSKCLFRPN